MGVSKYWTRYRARLIHVVRGFRVCVKHVCPWTHRCPVVLLHGWRVHSRRVSVRRWTLKVSRFSAQSPKATLWVVLSLMLLSDMAWSGAAEGGGGEGIEVALSITFVAFGFTPQKTVAFFCKLSLILVHWWMYVMLRTVAGKYRVPIRFFLEGFRSKACFDPRGNPSYRNVGLMRPCGSRRFWLLACNTCRNDIRDFSRVCTRRHRLPVSC